jgi:hypothetical protein
VVAEIAWTRLRHCALGLAVSGNARPARRANSGWVDRRGIRHDPATCAALTQLQRNVVILELVGEGWAPTTVALELWDRWRTRQTEEARRLAATWATNPWTTSLSELCQLLEDVQVDGKGPRP